MTNVSKQKLSPEVRKRLTAQMGAIFATTHKHEATDLFNNLLTESEEVMLTKRIAIIVMLVEGYSTYKIAKSLYVSDVTVAAIRAKKEHGDYEKILEVITHKKFNAEQFWMTVEVILRGGMPSMVGKGRWKQILK